MINVLVADDEKNILDLYRIRLERNGYNVFTSSDGEEALEIFYNNRIDIMIVDIMMPKVDGYELVKEIRDGGYDTPVIMVTAKGELKDKVEGFRVGIDDYLVKPIEFEELFMRMNSIFRRLKINSSNKIEVGSVCLDSNTLSIYNENTKIVLSKKEFDILFKLLLYPERSFTKSQLFDEFWGIDSNADLDSVKVYISKIRNQIQIFDEIDIETIRGIGYRGVRNDKK